MFGQFSSLQFFLFGFDLTNDINCTIWGIAIVAEKRSFWDPIIASYLFWDKSVTEGGCEMV